MAYTNVINTFVLEPFYELMIAEFKGVRINYDKHTGHRSFVMKSLPDTIGDTSDGSQVRDYEIEIIYDHLVPKYDKSTFKILSEIAERIKKLVYDNQNFRVEKTWVQEGGTWGSTTTVWSSDRDTVCWSDGSIPEIDYSQDEIPKGHSQVKLIFNCSRYGLATYGSA